MINTKTLEAEKKDVFKVTDIRVCPDCMGLMAEVDRVKENGFSFVWYQCTRIDCDGQWLEKKLD